MPEEKDKGLYASVVDTIARLLEKVLAFFAGWWAKSGQVEKERLNDKIENLEKQDAAHRRQSNPAERDRVRDAFRDKSENK